MLRKGGESAPEGAGRLGARGLADLMEGIARSLIEAIPQKIEEASVQQLMAAASLAIEKMQALRTLPGPDSSLEYLSDERIDRELEELLAKARGGSRRRLGAS
jgi:hypothetical protein